MASSRMFPGQNHMLHGPGLLFPGPFLPYQAMPSHLNAMNFAGAFLPFLRNQQQYASILSKIVLQGRTILGQKITHPFTEHAT